MATGMMRVKGPKPNEIGRIVSRPNNEEYKEGHERTFGMKSPERGKWKIDRATGRLIQSET